MFSQPFRLGRKGTIRDNPISSKHSLLDIRIDDFQSRKGQSCEIYIFFHDWRRGTDHIWLWKLFKGSHCLCQMRHQTGSCHLQDINHLKCTHNIWSSLMVHKKKTDIFEREKTGVEVCEEIGQWFRWVCRPLAVSPLSLLLGSDFSQLRHFSEKLLLDKCDTCP